VYTKERLGPSQAGERLKQIVTAHNGRLPIYGSIGSRVLSELHELFDEFVAKELDEIREEIQILTGLGDHLDEEKHEFEQLKQRFSQTNANLTKHLEDLKQENPPDLDWRLGFTAWGLVGEINDLRGKVDRWTNRELRDHDRLIALLDEELRKRGIRTT
jgi:predicted nuclease with TOPRIM domain